jgi:hypothetical protein
MRGLWLGVAAWLAGWSVVVAGKAASSKVFIVVRTYGAERIAADSMESARKTVRAIFGRVGIDVQWHDCSAGTPTIRPEDACEHAVRSNEVIVRLVSGGANADAETVLGTSLVQHVDSASQLATIWDERVNSLALKSQVDGARLLGRAIAHELGHLLLERASHSDIGLMRAQWTTRELRDDRPTDWTFSRSEAAQLRHLVAARSQRAEGAPLLARRGG